MARSLKVANKFINKVKQSLLSKGFKSQTALAEALGLGRDTVNKFFNGKSIDRTIFINEICFHLNLDWQEITQPYVAKEDWQSAPEVLEENFIGRSKELEALGNWILRDRCRLVAIVGIGGIGKTEIGIKLGKGGIGKTQISLKLAQDIQTGFDFLIWRDLKNSPPLNEILSNIIQFISAQAETRLPASINTQISILIKYLRKNRCLVILDNAESILETSGKYRQDYEDYGQLFEMIGKTEHQSCLLITSREKFSNLEILEGKQNPVRYWELSGLSYTEGRQLFTPIEDFYGSEEQWQQLIEFYNGNPLALKLAANHIRDVFDGDIGAFWRDSRPIFSKLEDLLDWHFNRLNDCEQEILYWLAIYREPMGIADLKEDIVQISNKQKVADNLRSLQRKLSIDKLESSKRFSLHPVLMEYVIQKLIDRVCQELESKEILELKIFNSQSLIQASAKDYIRESQNRLILTPIILRLLDSFHGKLTLEKYLTSVIAKLRECYPLKKGYIAGNILNLFCQLNTNLQGYDFSNLVIWQADLRKVKLMKVNFSYCDLTRTAFRKSFGGVLDLSFSPDGEYLAVGDFNGEIHLLRVETWEEVAIFLKHPWHIAYVAFSPDSKKIVSSCLNGIIKLWDVQTGKCLWSQREHTEWVWSVSFHPQGKILASGSDDTTIKFWDVKTGQCYKTLQAHNAWVLSVAFSPDGQTLASSSFDRTIKLWNVETGECFRTFHGSEEGIWTVAFSPNGKIIASCGTEKVVRLWDVETGTCLKVLTGHTKEIKMLCFSYDGKVVASGSFAPDSTVKFWDVETGECITTGLGHSASVRTISFHPSNQIVATGDIDQTLKIWDVQSGRCIRTLQGNTRAIWSVAYSHDGNAIASSHLDNQIRLWDANTGKLAKTLTGHDAWIWEVVFSPDRKTLASCGDDETIKIWDLETGKVLQNLRHTKKEYHGGIWSIAFSPDGKSIVSGGQDNAVKIWDLRTGTIKILQGHMTWITSVAVSPNGKNIASASNDHTLRIWDYHTEKCLHVCEGHTNKLRALAYSDDGKLLVTGSEDRTLKIWDAATGKCLNTLYGHEEGIFSANFGARNQLIVSGSEDHNVRVWDVNTGQCKSILHGHTGIRATMFSPDGQNIVSAGLDSTIKIWNVQTGNCVRDLTLSRPYEGMNIREVTGTIIGQKESLKSLGAFA